MITPLRDQLRAFERQAVLNAIKDCEGDRGIAAAALQISVATLYRKMAEDDKRSVEPPGRVYLLHNMRAKAYKIGCSSSPSIREKTMLAQDPGLLLVGHWRGARIDEHRLHQRFAAKRIRGEWFELSPEDVAEIGAYFSLINHPVSTAVAA